MRVFQFDHSGLYQGFAEADESPLEPGVYLLPARSTRVSPPALIPAGQWPRWNGSAWELVARPYHAQDIETDPVQKLRNFLSANPDVAVLIQGRGL